METTFVLDVNETLLDMSALDEHFERAFGAARVRQEWLSETIGRALICNAVNDYRPFPDLAEAALDALAARYGVRAQEHREIILHRFSHLPLHTDAAAALAHLQNGGLRVAALTNSPLEAVEASLTRTGVRDRFHDVLSVETIRLFKPDRRAYEMAATALNEAPSRLWLISAHWWDCLGAARLGWKTAFVKRPGSHNDGTMVRPLHEFADLLSAVHRLAPLTEFPAP